MTARAAAIALVLLTVLPFPRALFAFQTPTSDPRSVVPIATARAVGTPPRIDGRLTDPVWLEATPVTARAAVTTSSGGSPIVASCAHVAQRWDCRWRSAVHT